MGENNKAHRTVDTDQGWAWIVLVGASLGMSLIALAYTGGIFNMTFLEVFGKSKQTTAWLTAVQSSLWSLGGPLSSVLTQRLGARCTCMLGGFIGCLGYLLTYFADNFIFAFFSFGILAGLGLGMSFVPLIVITSAYFEKRRNLAFGVTHSALAIGTIVLPIIIIKCNEYFGWRGCMLILAGLFMQLIVSGALFKPNNEFMHNYTVETVEQGLSQNGELSVLDNGTANTKEISEQYSKDLNNALGKIQSSHNISVESLPFMTMVSSSKLTINTDSKPSETTPSKHGMHFMKNGPFLLLCASLFGVNAASFICYIHFPAYFTMQGASESDIATSLMALGILNVICRLLGGIATNSPDIDVLTLYISSCGISGILMLFCPLMSSSYSGQLAFSALFGFYGNWFYSLLAPITVQLLSVEDLPLAYGMENFFGGIGGLVGPPCAGWLFDVSGSYVYSFYTAGILFMMSAILMMAAPIISHQKASLAAQPEI